MLGIGGHVLAAVGGAIRGTAAPGDGGVIGVMLFYVFAAVTVGGALVVAGIRDMRAACLGLLGCMAGLAGLYFLLHAEFMAAVQLMVGVGGTVVMGMVGLVLLRHEPAALARVRRGEVIWVIVLAVILAVGLCGVVVLMPWQVRGNMDPGNSAAVEDVGRSLASAHGGYLLVLELASVVLMTVMVGASYLARPRRPATPSSPAVVETLAPSRAARGRTRR